MKNKEIVKFLEKELKSFTDLYWEIKETKDYILFIKTLSDLSVSFKNQPLWISISEIIKDKKEMNKVVHNLNKVMKELNFN